MNIRKQLANEIALQESMGFVLPPRELVPTPKGLLEAQSYHDRFYVPPTDPRYLEHCVTARSNAELAEIFDAAEDLCGGTLSAKNNAIKHESQHGATALHLGQKSLLFVVRVEFDAAFEHRGRTVRPCRIIPSTVLEDMTTTPLGVGLMLSAPDVPSENDLARLSGLGLTPALARHLAQTYNEAAETKYYPV